MRAVSIDTQEAPNKWWAARDAQMRSAVNATSYSDREKTRAERMRSVLTLVYDGNFYISFGRRGITVKVDRARIVDRKNLQILEQDWEMEGIRKRISPQGVVYNIPRG